MNDTQIVSCLLKMLRGSIVNFKVGKNFLDQNRDHRPLMKNIK